MSVRRLAEHQPESFAFTPENLEWTQGQIAKYPPGRQASAVIPLLWKAQEQAGGWLPEPAIRLVADMLAMPYIRVLEVATFYTMFALEPVGRHFIQLCGTVPCALMGARELRKICEHRIGHENEVSENGLFSWLEVECLGACTNAPMAQINYDYFEDLTPESFDTLLDRLEAGLPVTPGPQDGRQQSAPAGGPTTLFDPGLFDGSMIGGWRKRFEPKPEAALAEAAPAGAAAASPPSPPPQPTQPREAAKPKETGSGEKAASDSPADRTDKGQAPISAAKQAEAANGSTAGTASGAASPPLSADTKDGNTGVSVNPAKDR